MRHPYRFIAGLGCATVVGGVLLWTSSEDVKAQTSATAVRAAGVTGPAHLRGGPRGAVKTARGQPAEGIMVQLISSKSAVRTTVYTNEFGTYEFPRLHAGDYTLRLARPLEYRPYRKDAVRIDGATMLADIVVERVTNSEYLPPTAAILPQLSGAEWVANLPGTAQEKKSFVNACGGSCHSFQMQMRARFDEPNWRKLILRMTDYGGRTLIGTAKSGSAPTEPFETPALAGMHLEKGEMERVVRWLVKVRGLDAQDPPIKTFPRPKGPATRAIVTEYELPFELANIHDVAGDSEGNIWFTINRHPFIGKLDPKTGKVVSYRTPTADGKMPGLHWIKPDKNGIVWFSAPWADGVGRLDTRTGDFRMVYGGPTHSMDLSPDGFLWERVRAGILTKYDPSSPEFWATGNPVKSYPLPKKSETYGIGLSWDGKYFGGGGNNGIVWVDTQTGEVREVPLASGMSAHGRGNFDPDGNLWVGSKHGMLVKYDHRTGLVSEYPTPTPYANFYGARADKHGHIWAGEMHAGKIARLNPRTGQWIEYVLPTPWSQDYNSWIDNSTNPVTYWYGDQYGYIVRVQPLE